MCSLSIVIPVYNSGDTIASLVEQLANLPIEGGHELILVNDGSKDNTAEVCEALVPNATFPVRFINLSRNFGEHNAVMAGLRYARGEYVITMDDDLQNPPSEVVKLFKYAREQKKDVIYTYYKQKQHSAWRNFGSWLTNQVADILLDKPKNLYLCSFRCMNSFLVQQICQYEGPFPYVDGLILQVTQSIGQLEVAHSPRQQGQSSYNLRKLVRLWLNMFLNFSVIPLRLSTAVGFLFSAVGFLGTLYVVVDHFIEGAPLGWSSLMFTLLLFSGVQLLILGIAGEYIGRLYLTSNKRPQFVVRNIVTPKPSETYNTLGRDAARSPFHPLS
ncbi:MAG: glycosyltransferase family 2 protein [Cyanobacteriota bacterium]|nr:glycosyltransferase family 2 protein [Cyanobacteriota bacterium]